MQYYNDTKGRYETIVLDSFDLKVKENVIRIHNDNQNLDNEIKLYNEVERYYNDEIGIMNHRLQKVIEHYSNELFEVAE